ncbi:MAG TPA: 4-hydroxy-3-methylbut-2-enyl diphosphate reductase [Bacteroidia bacterium]|nr:4-hydroxy-3-methylbut-2-enyl diphosphate reductase [Bacteroidia bacterium]
MKQLRITIDSNSGFCFGVVYAIKLAEEILNEYGRLFCLGDIVHNDAEIERLKQKGLEIISHEELIKLKDERVLIRAHGEPPATYRIALENNLTLIDASCPVVLKLQNRVKQTSDEEKNIFIYGKRGHAEVEGLIGQTGKDVTVFQDLNELNWETIPSKISLYSQTTKSTEKFYTIYNQLVERGIEVELNDTTCRQVSNRDIQLREFALAHDVIVFVSGLKSSNGKVLYVVCKASNPRTYFISKAEEINPQWFGDNSTVGICGATSTPMWLMEEVRERIGEY